MRKTIKQLQGESDYWRIKFINEQKRAEAAEAKLADLEKQEPVGKQYRVSAKGNNSATGWSLWHDGDGEQYRNSYDVQVRNVFNRPAPAVSLAELVPDCLIDAMCKLDLVGVSIGDKAIIGKAIEVLQNIEEASK